MLFASLMARLSRDYCGERCVVGPWHVVKQSLTEANLRIEQCCLLKNMTSSRFRLTVQLLCFALPWKLRRWVLTKALGFSIDPTAWIGLSIILADEVELERKAIVGNLNYIGRLDRLILREETNIGSYNWITGLSRRVNTPHFKHRANRRSDLILGKGCMIGTWHLIDCTDAVEIGAFSGLTGARSQILTHGVDLFRNRQDCGPVIIGAYVPVATGVIILKGVTIADRCIIGPGSVVTKSFTEPYSFVAGNPAVFIRKCPEKLKTLHRTEGAIV
jgi:acetyltransferase-like isoleucine patch superfamily enzyme